MSVKFASRFINRNPRNMERLGRQIPPTGYQFEKDCMLKSYLYKAELIQSKAHQEARVIHYKDGVVVSASTREKAIANQLYSNTDTCAAMNLGRILADRCLKSGILFALRGIEDEQLNRSLHQQEFFKALSADGVSLVEPSPLEHNYTSDKRMTWERYPLKATREYKLDEL